MKSIAHPAFPHSFRPLNLNGLAGKGDAVPEPLWRPEDYEYPQPAARAIEAQRAETTKIGSVHESAVAPATCPKEVPHDQR